MTALLDLLMAMLGIATWQKKGRQVYPPLIARRKLQQVRASKRLSKSYAR